MSLGVDTSLYGYVVRPGLFRFKKELGFTPVPAQTIDRDAGMDTADRFQSLRSLTDPSLLLVYDSSYAAWDKAGSAPRPKSFVLQVLTTRDNIDLRPYRAGFLTDVLVIKMAG